MRWYIVNLLIAVDQVFTALLGGFADETMSSYAFRLERQRKLGGRLMRPVIDTIFFWMPNHCRDAYEAEVERRQMPPELR